MAFDLYTQRIRDANIQQKFVERESWYAFRDMKVLVEIRSANDYSYHQPIAKIIRIINEYEEMFSFNRVKFKMEVRKLLKSEINGNSDV